VCQYRHLCKLAHGCPEAPKETDDKKIMSGTSDRRFDMLFCIVAEYIMPMGIKEVDAPENMHMKVIGEICEHLKMGTVSHLEGYKQLRKYKPSSKIINDISMRVFGRLGEPKVSRKKISIMLFDELVCHFSDQLQELYQDFRNTLVDLENHS